MMWWISLFAVIWISIGASITAPTFFESSFNKDMQGIYNKSPLSTGFKHVLYVGVIVYLVLAWPWLKWMKRRK